MQANKGAESKINVEYTARLARIALSEGEQELFQGQLEKIIGYIDEISKVDVSGVEPMAYTTATRNVYRPDAPRAGLDRETVLKMAPAHDNRQFIVPRIV